MQITEQIIGGIIKKLLRGDDYRIKIVTLINAAFLQFTVDFFKKVVDAKLKNEGITADWYKKAFLNAQLAKDDIAIHSGLNMKTISNMFNSSTKEVVINAADEHFDALYGAICALAKSEEGLDLNLTLKFRDVSVNLNIGETLIVINTLAVKRAALRGGLWSTAGKRVEKPLMETLCRLYQVPPENYRAEMKSAAGKKADFIREVDFYLIKDGADFKCEVKLIGKGNPESADAVIARDSQIFVADKLSDTNKKQLDSMQVEWVELRSKTGFRKFKKVLENLNIPHQELDEKNLNQNIEKILKK